jgi:hypothetical protein
VIRRSVSYRRRTRLHSGLLPSTCNPSDLHRHSKPLPYAPPGGLALTCRRARMKHRSAAIQQFPIP